MPLSIPTPEPARFVGNKTITGSLTIGGQILAATGSQSAPGLTFSAASDRGWWQSSGYVVLAIANVSPLAISNSKVVLGSDVPLTWTSASASTGAHNGTPDVFLCRDAAGILAQRNGATAQAFNVYNTYTDSANNEFGAVGWISNEFWLQATKLGSGSARAMKIGTTEAASINFVTSNTSRWQIAAAGHLQASGSQNLNIWNGTSALATTATAGFLGVNSCAGPPTGVPASIPTGQIPMVYDSVNDKLYIYRSGWKTLAAAFA